MRLRILTLACTMLLGLAMPTLARQAPSLPLPARPAIAPAVPPATQTAPGTPALSKTDVESWLDGLMPYALARANMAGAVVVVVKDGQVLLEKGFGYADVATHRPIDPETTLFRPGSVSKLFTWTAVMQLVEQGKIDLDRDVNTYLDFRIPPFQGQPVTMRNLMTHTGGFEEAVKDLITSDPKQFIPLDQYTKSYLPARIFPPGQVPAYSNYGATLAGYIVQRVSGEPFDDYVARHIFAPLGMTHATFQQPLPPRLQPFMSSGYAVATGPSKPFEFVIPAPAGSSAVSGGDMAKFMIAHLQDGFYNGQRILSEATAREMHATPLTIIPRLHRMLLGFYEMNRNGHRIIGHLGDTSWFHSELALFPDDHVGFFLSLNSAGKGDASLAIRNALLDGFANRYFPGPGSQGRLDPQTARADAAILAGTYESSRRSETNFLSLLNLIETATVTASANGDIRASSIAGLNGQPSTFEPIAPFVWREAGGHALLAAKMDDSRVVFWSEGDFAPFEVFMPEPWVKSPAWLLPACIAAVVALLVTAFFWPVSAIVRRRYRHPFPHRGALALSYRAVRIAALLSGLLIIIWSVIEALMIQNFWVTPAMDPLISALHITSIIIFPLAVLVAIANLGVVWRARRGWRGIFARLWSVVLALATVTLLWVGVAFHLVGVGVRY